MHKLLKITSLLFICNILRKNWVIKLIFCMQISMKVPNKLLLWFLLLCEIYPFCNYFFPSQHYLFWISFFWCSIVSLWGFSHVQWPLIESSSFFLLVFQGFLSWTLATHWTPGIGRGPSFIWLKHFHPLMNIQTLILQFWMWDDYHIFLIAPLVFSRLLLDEIYHLIKQLFEWLVMWCQVLFVYFLVWFKVFVTAIWHWKLVDLNSHRLSSLYYKWTEKPSVLLTPNLEN